MHTNPAGSGGWHLNYIPSGHLPAVSGTPGATVFWGLWDRHYSGLQLPPPWLSGGLPISGPSRCHLQPAFSSLPDRAATSNSSHGLPASWNSTGELSLWSSALTHRHSCRSCLPTGVPTHCDQGAGSRALWVLAAGFPRAPSPGRPSGQSLSATVFHVCVEQGRENCSHTQIPPGTKGCCPQGTQFLVPQSFPPE